MRGKNKTYPSSNILMGNYGVKKAKTSSKNEIEIE
jgi:hypothetical protein